MMRCKPLVSLPFQQALLALSLTLVTPPALAQEADSDATVEISTVWQCSYDNGTVIYCRVAVAQIDEEPLPQVGASSKKTSLSYYPKKGPLPNLVAKIHRKPASLVDRTIAIPMFSQAEDMEIARELADAVVCDAQESCRIEFVASTSVGSTTILPPPNIATR